MFSTNEQLKEYLKDSDCAENLSHAIILEGDEFASAAVGVTLDGHVVYDYNSMVSSLASKYTDVDSSTAIEQAMEWIDYNTLRSLPYMKSEGNEPIIVNLF